MALSGAIFQVTMLGELASSGFIGPQSPTMALAVGLGSYMSLAGKMFTTKDTGTLGVGVGVGIGIINLTKSVIAGHVFDEVSKATGTIGEKLQATCIAIGAGLEAEVALASLIGTHPTVAVGSGVVDPGSYTVEGGEWGSNITSAGPFSGEKWADFAKAVGKGCANSFQVAAGQLIIAGAPIIPPSPGSGTGTGVLV